MVTDYYLPTLGGIQTSIKAQKDELEKLSHKVTVMCPLHEPSPDPTVIQLPTFKHIRPDNYPLAGTGKKVIKAVKNELALLGDVDAVHVHSDMAAGVGGLIAAKALGIPVIQTMHGREDVYTQKILPFPELTSIVPALLHNRYINHAQAAIDLDDANAQTRTGRRMWRLMVSHANYADFVIVPSYHFAKKLKKHGVTKQMAVISNGIEDSVLRQLKGISPRSYKKGEVFKIMWCGRMSPEKRPMEFLKAIAAYNTNIQVDMYGDGVTLKDAQRFINAHGLTDTVKLFGGVSQKEVLEAMRMHHVFISTSYNFDNQPMVLLEAAAAGLPVLYCDPDMGEIVPSAASLLTKNPEPDGIAYTIKFLKAQPEKIERMSKAMLNHREYITQKNHIHELVKIYKKVIAKNRILTKVV